MTITDALRQGMQELEKTSDAPAIDAQRLLLHVLKEHETSWLFAHGETVLPAPQKKLIGELLQRRLSGEPLAYIVGSQDFYGRPFAVTPAVLIPRPSTEALIDQALTAIKKISEEKRRPLVIADIGTGSGCIIVTLACELANFQFPSADWRTNFQFIATDISRPALRVAKKNAQRYHVADRIEFLHGDMLAPLVNKNVDLLVSNPPYVLTHELRDLETPEKKGLAFEPCISLDGGTDGQRFINKIRHCYTPSIVEGTGGTIYGITLS